MAANCPLVDLSPSWACSCPKAVVFSKVAVPICSSFTIGAGGCHFPCKKALWRKGKGANEERKRKKKKSKQKQTIQSIGERKASALLWLKWLETRSVQKLKKKRYFRAEEGEGKCCSCRFSASRAALPVFHLDQYATSKCFPVKMQPALQLILAS